MLRRLAAAALVASSLCVTLATCTDLPTGTKHRVGRVALVPEFTPSALRVAKQLASFSMAIDSVRIVLLSQTVPPHTVLDTTIFVSPSDTLLDLTFTVPGVQP